jgi:Hpt domain
MVRGSNVVEIFRHAPKPLQKRPLDMLHLAKQALGDWGIEVEVLRLYDEMIGTYFARLEASTSIPDLLMHLHTIKGASAGVGAWTVRDYAKTAEDELREGKPVNPERIDDVGIAVEEVRAFITDLLKDEPL